MSWRAMMKVRGERELVGNGLRFKTREEAEQYARDLYSRWTLTEGWEVQESNEEANR